MITQFVEHGDVQSLSEHQQEALGAVVKRLHRYRPPADFVGPGGQGGPTPMVERICARYRRACLHVELPSVDSILPVVADSIQREDATATSHLLHMDLRPANLCFRQDRLVALIDLTNCIVGSRFAELGRLYAYGGLSREFLAGYGVREFTSTEWTRILSYAVDTLAMLITVAAEELMDGDMLDRLATELVSVTAALAPTAR
jgi:aminoglycoside phosphotransferase (APT) family kinase protein